MKTPRIVLATAVAILVLMFLGSCGGEQKAEIEKEKQEYQAKIEESLKDINQEINKLEAQLDTAGGETQEELMEQIQNLESLKYDLRQKTAQLKETGDDGWEKFKSSVDNTLEKVNSKINEVSEEIEEKIDMSKEEKKS